MGGRLISDAGFQKNFAFDLRHKDFVYDQADGERAAADLPAGGMDSTAYSKMLLDSVAFGCRTGARATPAPVARPHAESRIQFAWGVASGRYRQFADGPGECGVTPLWLPHAIGSRRGVIAAGFNRRIRKTVRTVLWEGDGAQSPSLDPILGPAETQFHGHVLTTSSKS